MGALEVWKDVKCATDIGYSRVRWPVCGPCSLDVLVTTRAAWKGKKKLSVPQIKSRLLVNPAGHLNQVELYLGTLCVTSNGTVLPVEYNAAKGRVTTLTRCHLRMGLSHRLTHIAHQTD